MSEDKKPTLKELLLYVVPHAVLVWEELGIALNLDEDGITIDTIAEKRAGDAKKCCLDVLKLWLQGKGEEPKSWAVLIRCLDDASAEDAIESIKMNMLGGVKSTSTLTENTPKPQTLASSNECTREKEATAGTSDDSQSSLASSVVDSQTLLPPQATDSEPASDSMPSYKVRDDGTDEVGAATTLSSCEPAPCSLVSTPEDHTEELLSLTERGKGGREQVESEPALLEANEPTQPDSLRQPLSLAIQHPMEIDLLPADAEDIPKLKPSHVLTDPTDGPQTSVASAPQVQDLDNSRDELDFSLKLADGREIRAYQKELALPGMNGENYIICAPTGTGKTLVAGIIVADSLQKTRGHGKVIFVVNTKPLAQQQVKELDRMIPNARVECCTGDDGMTINSLLSDKEIVVCTAGKLLNELKLSMLKLKQIKLLVIDECHHTVKSTPQARVMQKYLEAKSRKSSSLPQVVGLTASPGAGDNPRVELDKTLDHLTSLCALMDATSGIKKTVAHIRELEKYTNKPQFTTKIRRRREATEAFITTIINEMERLEVYIGFNCHFNKWSQEYENSTGERKRHFEMSTDPENRHRIAILEVIMQLSRALNVYMDLRYEDAMRVFSESQPPEVDGQNETEIQLAVDLEQLRERLARLPRVPNPLLLTLKENLVGHFSRKPDSKGIVFVRTKRHAASICEWIQSMDKDVVAIRPRVMTGHTHETGLAMTQVQQTQAITDFHSGKVNLLVATSVAEEGLDVPACNLVIRFQHVSNEIAKTQTRGRVRAAGGEGFAILSSDSKRAYKEFKNSELEALVDEALQVFPDPHVLRMDLEEKQRKMLQQWKMKKVLRREKKKQNHLGDIQLMCKRCKTFACRGTDIYTMEDSTHHIVPDKGFRERIVEKKRPPNRVTESMVITNIMLCKKCNSEWGIICSWPSQSNNDFPVLKCKQFIFEIAGQPRPVKKWSEAPFEIPPLLLHPNYQLDEDEDTSSSDSEY